PFATRRAFSRSGSCHDQAAQVAASADVHPRRQYPRIAGSCQTRKNSGRAYQVRFKVPGGTLAADDDRKPAHDAAFTGNTIGGTDFVTLRLLENAAPTSVHVSLLPPTDEG